MQPLEVRDLAGTGQRARVEEVAGKVLAHFAKEGHALRRPVKVVLEHLQVPGFTESHAEAHVLHLRADAAGQDWLPGLLARQVAHAALADEGHASHAPELLQSAFAAARERSRDVHFLGLVGTLNHHVRDCYADALTAQVHRSILPALLARLGDEALAALPGPHTMVTLAYLAGTHRRLVLDLPGPLAKGLEAAPGAAELVEAFASLPPEPAFEELEARLVAMVGLLPEPA